MGLSEDQKAMLRLLAQREQGYDDIAALMGLSVEQVRERVKAALEQLDAEGEAPPEELRPAGPVAAGDPPSPPVAKASSEMGPPTAPPAGGEVPVEPVPVPQAAPKEQSSQAAQAPKRLGSGLPKLSLPEGQGARTGLAAGALALVVLVVVLVVGGGGDGSDTTVSGGTSANGEPTSGNAKELTKAVLQPVGGSGATGVAIFGRVGKDSLALQVEAEGLKQTSKGQSYAIWVAASQQRMLPLASTAVGQDGRIATQFAVPTEVLAYLADETFGQIAITEVEDSRLKTALNKATNKGQAPSYTGTEVLRGEITGPIIGAANKDGN